jgi:UDP-GlcNAc3NAcA epimerase
VKIVTILGARPQFIKAAPVTSVMRERGHQETLVHTGQHYDYGMSEIFFKELEIPEPEINLQVGSGSHCWQTGTMMIRLEEILSREKPDWVLVYGDTNSTLSGALAACKLRLPLVHIEAGLRSFNREMPEEHNRVITDHCADILFCPTQTAASNLSRESITEGVYWVGDTMYDAVLKHRRLALQESSLMKTLALKPKEYLLATVHRPYNTDNADNLRSILKAFGEIGEPIVFPVHPRTRKSIGELDNTIKGIGSNDNKVKMIDPVSYLEMIALQQEARVILTDSGGIQKEAYFLGVPCVTLRPETEWKETLQAGWNTLVGSDCQKILSAVRNAKAGLTLRNAFGDGHAALHIVDQLEALRTSSSQ